MNKICIVLNFKFSLVKNHVFDSRDLTWTILEGSNSSNHSEGLRDLNEKWKESNEHILVLQIIIIMTTWLLDWYKLH